MLPSNEGKQRSETAARPNDGPSVHWSWEPGLRPLSYRLQSIKMAINANTSQRRCNNTARQPYIGITPEYNQLATSWVEFPFAQSCFTDEFSVTRIAYLVFLVSVCTCWSSRCAASPRLHCRVSAPARPRNRRSIWRLEGRRNSSTARCGRNCPQTAAKCPVTQRHTMF